MENNRELPLAMQDLYPDRPLMRWLMKTPTLTWRLGLGPLTGKIFLLLTTTGRKSGQPRRTMLEYFNLEGHKYVVSAFGERSDWYRNLLQNTRVTIQTSGGTQSAYAVRVMDADELWEVLQGYMRHDPPLTSWYLKSNGVEYNREAVIEARARLHLIRFDPRPDAAPSGQEVDLAWIWPLTLLVIALGYLLGKKR